MTRRDFLAAATFAKALPGYRYEFPRDHFSHAGFQTEWWYYTGNLIGANLGFELTFFRAALEPEVERKSIWTTRDAWMAHLALTDAGANQFRHAERLNRSGPGLAGVDAGRGVIWNGNWSSRITPGAHYLKATAEDFAIDLELEVLKPHVIHGEKGVSQKGPKPGQASHYITFSRLGVKGTVTVGGTARRIDNGYAWMDHEYFSSELDPSLAGWDWFSIQLNNNTELMLYRLRQKDGTASAFSAGTYIDGSGKATHINATEMKFSAGRKYKNYPVEWTIEIPRYGMQLKAVPRMDGQELTSRNRLTPSYWEGAMRFEGTHQGVGYLEMTGYDDRVQFSRK